MSETSLFKKKKSSVAIATSIILAILLIGAFFLFRNNSSDETKKSDSKKPSTTSKTSPKSNGGSSASTTDSTTDSGPDENNNITIALNSPIQGQTFSGIIVVRTVVTGTSEGKCTATFTQENSVDVVVEAAIIQAPTYKTCEGFDVDRSKFPRGGTWSVQVKVKSGKSEGKSEKREFTIV